MAGYLSVERQGGIAVLRIDRPPANAMNLDLLDEGQAVATELRADLPDAVVITGREGYFSAGVDLKFAPTLDIPGQRAMVNGINGLFLDWYSFPRPVVCAVNGHAIAGGFILMLCGDYRVGSTEGKYGITELRVGAPFPLVAMAAIQAELSPQAARQLVLRAHLVDGEEALRLGAFDELREPPEVLPRALQIAGELAEMIHTYERVKRQLRGETIERMKESADTEASVKTEAWLGQETGQAAASILRDGGTDK